MSVRIFYIISFIVTLNIGTTSNAFDYQKCRRVGVGNGAGYFLSTTSYVSSTGPCSMIGKFEHDRKIFFAENFDKILDDFARGNGEYAMTFARLSGCTQSTQTIYPKLMKKNFVPLLNSYSSELPEQTFKKLILYFETEPNLIKNCNMSGV